jgi:hypothetical protein
MYNHCEVIEPLHLIEKIFGVQELLWVVLSRKGRTFRHTALIYFNPRKSSDQI